MPESDLTREERIAEMMRKMVELHGVQPERARKIATDAVDNPSTDRAPSVTDLRRLLEEEG